MFSLISNPPAVIKTLRRILGWRDGFPLLVLLVLAVNLPLFKRTLWYNGDTIYCFEMFYSFYNNLFWHHEFTHWLPFGTFGMQADYYQMVYLGPAQYLAGLLGSLFRISDAHVLFKASVTLQHLLLLLGTHLLGRELFKNSASVFWVSFGMIMSALWLPQINYNFRIYYLYPLLWYFLAAFIKTGEPHRFWSAGLVYVLAQIGAPAHYFLLYAFFSFLFFLPFLVHKPSLAGKLLNPSRKDLFYFSAFLAVTAVYTLFAYHSLDHLKSFVPGREGAGFSVSLDSFLNHGRELSPLKFLGLFYGQYPGQQPADDYSNLFAGVLPLVFFLYALLVVRRRTFLVFAALTLFTACLSVGPHTPVAAWVWRLVLPMRLVRYIGSLGGVIKMLLVLTAGFGLDHWLNRPEERKSRIALAVSGTTVLAFMLGLAFLNRHQQFYPVTWPLLFGVSGAAAALGIAAILRLRRPARLGLAVFLLCSFAEMGLFQISFIRDWPYRADWVTREAVSTAPFDFQPFRLLKPELTPRMIEAAFVERASSCHLQTESMQFLLFDPCLPWNYNTFHWAEGVADLLQNRFPDFLSNDHEAFLKNPSNAAYASIFGCSKPRIRLTNDVVFALTREEALAKLKTLTETGPDAVLEQVPPSLQKGPGAALSEPPGVVRVKEFSFNKLLLEADVQSPAGAWLYLAEAYHPGWHVRVNDAPAPMFRANRGFRAVFLEPGLSKVYFYYRDGMQTLRSRLLVLAGLGLLVWAFFQGIRDLRLSGTLKDP